MSITFSVRYDAALSVQKCFAPGQNQFHQVKSEFKLVKFSLKINFRLSLLIQFSVRSSDTSRCHL